MKLLIEVFIVLTVLLTVFGVPVKRKQSKVKYQEHDKSLKTESSTKQETLQPLPSLEKMKEENEEKHPNATDKLADQSASSSDEKSDESKEVQDQAEKQEETTIEENRTDDEEDEEDDKDEPKTKEEKDREEDEEENPELFEGDLKLPKKEVKQLLCSTESKRDATTDRARKWTNAVVPYILDRSINFSRKKTIERAIAEFNYRTCVRFVPRRNEANYVRFIVGKGCYSTEVGKSPTPKEQVVSIGADCNYIGVVIHEMMHAIGFFHEQSRLDRDQYVSIFWANIEKDMESQFVNYAHGAADYLGEPYDYDSVMHYHRTAFGVKDRAGRPMTTIIAKDRPWKVLGQRKGFSLIDLKQINKLYKCKAYMPKL